MVESFIIQIYRRDSARSELAGTVERVADGSKQSFTTAEELWLCLSAKPSSRRQPRPRKADAGEPRD